MTNHVAIEAAIELTVTTADVHWDEPKDQRVYFDRKLLDRVMEVIRTPDGLNAVVAAINSVFRLHLFRAQEAFDEDHAAALASLRLEEKVMNPPGRRYREGPNGLEPLD